jgi:hypothetical protein
MDRQQLRSELRKEGLLERGRSTQHVVSNGSPQLKLDGSSYSLAGAGTTTSGRSPRRSSAFKRPAGKVLSPAREKALRTGASHSPSLTELSGYEAVIQIVMSDKREEDASEATVNSRYMPVLDQDCQPRQDDHPSGAGRLPR